VLTSVSFGVVVRLTEIALQSASEDLLSNMFSALFRIYSENRPLVANIDPAPLVSILVPFLRLFEPRSLAVLTLISKSCDCLVMEETFAVLPQFLCDLISQSPVVFPRPAVKHSTEDLPALPEFAFSLVKKEHETFPDGLLALPSSLRNSLKVPCDSLAPSVLAAILGMSSYLTECSTSCFNSFFIWFPIVLRNMQRYDHFFDCFAGFLAISKRVATMSSRIVELEDVFFPLHQTIFDDSGLDPVLNIFRTALIASYRETEVFDLLELCRGSPLLTAELLGRLLVIPYPVQKFGRSSALSLILENALVLQQLDLRHESPGIRSARNVSFQFLLHLAQSDDTELFASHSLCYGFLRFAFESDVAPIVFSVLQSGAPNIHCFDHIVSFAGEIV
jgi:hypothetical protein